MFEPKVGRQLLDYFGAPDDTTITTDVWYNPNPQRYTTYEAGQLPSLQNVKSEGDYVDVPVMIDGYRCKVKAAWLKELSEIRVAAMIAQHNTGFVHPPKFISEFEDRVREAIEAPPDTPVVYRVATSLKRLAVAQHDVGVNGETRIESAPFVALEIESPDGDLGRVIAAYLEKINEVWVLSRAAFRFSSEYGQPQREITLNFDEPSSDFRPAAKVPSVGLEGWITYETVWAALNSLVSGETYSELVKALHERADFEAEATIKAMGYEIALRLIGYYVKSGANHMTRFIFLHHVPDGYPIEVTVGGNYGWVTASYHKGANVIAVAKEGFSETETKAVEEPVDD